MKSLLSSCCLLAVCVLATGCGQNPLIKWTNSQAEEMERLTRLFNEIQTPEDADQRLEEIRDGYRAMAQLKRDAPAMFRKHAKDKVLKSTAEKAQKRLQRADQALIQAAGKLENRRDFSEPFGSMLRVESMEFMFATVESLTQLNTIDGMPRQPSLGSPDAYREPLRMYREHGPAKVVEIEVVGGRGATQQLRDAAGSGAEVYSMADGTVLMIGPVEDFDAFRAAAAEQGDLTEIDPGRRSFKYRPTFGSGSGSAVADRESGRADRASSRFGGGFFDDDPADETAEPDLGATPTGPPRNEQEAIIQRMLAQARGETVPPAGGASTASGDGPDWSQPAPAGAAATPQPATDPALANLSPSEQRYLQLAERLTGENRLAKRTAADQLLAIRPTAIKTRAIRQKVARGFRTLLSDADFMATDGENVVRGLEAYAGEHSVPLLLDHLATRPAEVPAAAIDALAKHPSPAGARALVVLLESLANREQATEALRNFGPDAEPALLAAVRKLDAAAKPIALELLGEIGTEASVPTLSQMSRSGRSNDRAAASDALRRVQDRL